MKNLALILALIFMTSTPSNAQEHEDEYTTNPDGTSSYIGNCVLHLDYLGKGIEKGTELAPTILYRGEEETRAFLKELSNEVRDLIRATAKVINPERAEATLTKIVQSFEELSIFELKLNYSSPHLLLSKS